MKISLPRSWACGVSQTLFTSRDLPSDFFAFLSLWVEGQLIQIRLAPISPTKKIHHQLNDWNIEEYNIWAIWSWKNPSCQNLETTLPPFHFYLSAVLSTSCHGQELFDHRDFQGFEQDLRGSSVQLMGTMGPRNPSWEEHVWRDGWVKLFVLVRAKHRYRWGVARAGKSSWISLKGSSPTWTSFLCLS